MKNCALFVAVIALLLILGAYVPCAAKDWDPVVEQDWTVGAPPGQPEAGAVVMFDKGRAEWQEKKLKFTRHRRLKVLTDAGAETASILRFQTAKYDNLHRFRARVLNQDGKEVEMEKKAVEKVTIGDLVFFTAQFDEVSPGDIVEWYYEVIYYGGYDKLGALKMLLFVQQLGGISPEIRRRLELGDGADTDRFLDYAIRNLPTWYFDSEFFTYHSELQVELFGQFKYGYYPSNLPAEAIKPKVESFYLGSMKEYTWSLEHVDPFSATGQDESRVSDRVAIYFNQLSVGYRNDIVLSEYSDDYWFKIGTELRGYLSGYSDRTRSCRKKAKKLAKGLTEERELVGAIYQFVAEEYRQPALLVALRPMNWNVGNFFKNKMGAAFESNLLLLEMLKAAGVAARPVFINTEGSVSFRQTGHFDHVIVITELEGQAVFLDACSDACEAGALPLFSGTGDGLIVEDDGLRFCKIAADVCETPLSIVQSNVP